jgi:putative flippase GtrA
MQLTSVTPADTALRLAQSELVRAGIVSVLALGLDTGLLLLLTYKFQQHYLLAASVSFVAGLLLNYILSTYWVFQTRRGFSIFLEFVIFSVVGLLGLAMTELLLYVFTGVLKVVLPVSKLLTAGVVFFWNFGVRKALLFTRHAEE